MTGGLYNPRPVDDTPVDGQLQHGVTSNRMFDHEADIDAHMADGFQELRTGVYHTLFGMMQTNASAAIVAGQLYAVPIVAKRDITLDRVAIQVRTGAAGNVRLGIYNYGTNLYPGILRLDIGVVETTAVEIDELTIGGDLVLPEGNYWAACISDATPTLQNRERMTTPLGHKATAFILGEVGWKVAQAYGALPNPFTAAGATITASQFTPNIMWRVKSND